MAIGQREVHAKTAPSDLLEMDGAVWIEKPFRYSAVSPAASAFSRAVHCSSVISSLR
jgi:hypothetical protein